MEESQNVKTSPMFKLPETAISGKFMMTKNIITNQIHYPQIPTNFRIP